jgi:hypothetical protein
MRTCIVLTVAESKRLIAKGVARLDVVQTAMREGLVSVNTGTTNSYVVEELLGEPIEKAAYVTGITLPMKGVTRTEYEPIPDIVFRDGKLTDEFDRFSVLKAMQPGDVVIKGANALNYEKGVAGILIGHPQGGTIGGILGSIVGRRLNLIIPVGLEKSVGVDIEKVAGTLREPDEYLGDVPRLWPVRGNIVTEIEALTILTGVKAMQMASGGVGGAEGGVRLLLEGAKEVLDDTLKFLDENIFGEPPFCC